MLPWQRVYMTPLPQTISKYSKSAASLSQPHITVHLQSLKSAFTNSWDGLTTCPFTCPPWCQCVREIEGITCILTNINLCWQYVIRRSDCPSPWLDVKVWLEGTIAYWLLPTVDRLISYNKVSFAERTLKHLTQETCISGPVKMLTYLLLS